MRFKEREPSDDPTRKPMFSSALSEGGIWIDQANGRVVKTEVWPTGRGSGPRDQGRPVSTTTFVFNDRLAVMMPSEMRTTWAIFAPTAGGVVTGVATYGTFKRFTVDATTTRIVIHRRNRDATPSRRPPVEEGRNVAMCDRAMSLSATQNRL